MGQRPQNEFLNVIMSLITRYSVQLMFFSFSVYSFINARSESGLSKLPSRRRPMLT